MKIFRVYVFFLLQQITSNHILFRKFFFGAVENRIHTAESAFFIVSGVRVDNVNRAAARAAYISYGADNAGFPYSYSVVHFKHSQPSNGAGFVHSIW